MLQKLRFPVFLAAVIAALAAGRPALAQTELPPDEAHAPAALDASPRHQEFVELEDPGTGKTFHTFVVYPERSDAAPVVIVIHEIFGLTEWVKGVADQLAKEGFIAVAPDFITGKGPNGGNSDSLTSVRQAVPLVSSLTAEEIDGALRAAVKFGQDLPASNHHIGAVGYCWGGRTSFNFAARTPGIEAAVVYYGTTPNDPERVQEILAPVLGLYGGEDARTTMTAEPGKKLMDAAGKSFEYHVYDGAGHGFLRQQDGMDGANLKASQDAWPRTLAFLREYIEPVQQ